MQPYIDWKPHKLAATFFQSLCVVIGLCGLIACSSTPETSAQTKPNFKQLSQRSIVMLIPPEHIGVDYAGQLPINGDSGNAGGMAYPSPTAAAMVAAVLTHAAIGSSMRSSQKSKAQKKADEVLQGYHDVFQSITLAELNRLALEHPDVKTYIRQGSDEQKTDAGVWRLHVSPLFLLAQDKQAIILRNTLALIDPENSGAVIYSNTVTSLFNVSSIGEESSPQELAKLSRDAYVESIKVFLKELWLPSRSERKAKTFRYQQGSVQRYERGTLAYKTSGRTVIKTLRGELMVLDSSS